MAVIFADGDAYYVARRDHPETEDEHGVPTPDPIGEATTKGPYPGATVDRGSGTYGIRLDPAAWPVDPDDVVTGGPHGDLVVIEARLHANMIDPSLDYVGGTCTLVVPDVR